MLKFSQSKEEIFLIRDIAKRAVNGLIGNTDYSRTLMDIEVTHCNGSPLNLVQLIKSGDGDFNHDVVGIISNINRNTGALENCFAPRCAAR